MRLKTSGLWVRVPHLVPNNAGLVQMDSNQRLRSVMLGVRIPHPVPVPDKETMWN
ncbi:hypothetical protein [Yersinia phage vB_YenM_P778]